jgi:hypothetical protein
MEPMNFAVRNQLNSEQQAMTLRLFLDTHVDHPEQIVEGQTECDNQRAYHCLTGVIGTTGRAHVRFFLCG